MEHYFILSSHKDILVAVPVVFQIVVRILFVSTEDIDCDIYLVLFQCN